MPRTRAWKQRLLPPSSSHRSHLDTLPRQRASCCAMEPIPESPMPMVIAPFSMPGTTVFQDLLERFETASPGGCLNASRLPHKPFRGCSFGPPPSASPQAWSRSQPQLRTRASSAGRTPIPARPLARSSPTDPGQPDIEEYAPNAFIVWHRKEESTAAQERPCTRTGAAHGLA
jgi:hypothetical protein